MRRGLSLLLALLIGWVSLSPSVLAESVTVDENIEAPLDSDEIVGEELTFMLEDMAEDDSSDHFTASDELETLPEEVEPETAKLYYARVMQEVNGIPMDAIVLVTGMAENGLMPVAWWDEDAMATDWLDASSLKALDEADLNAFLDAVALKTDVHLYKGQLNYPLPTVVAADTEAILEVEATEPLLAGTAFAVKVSAPAITLGKGETYSGLKAWVEDSEGQTVDNTPVTWRSADGKIATVEAATGKIKAKKEGKTTVYAETAGIQPAEIAVTVAKAPSSSSITLTPKTLSLVEGSGYQLSTAIKSGYASAVLTYTSNKKSVAKVSADGTVTALNPGKATITVKTFNRKKATCKVTVTELPASIVPEAETLRVAEGQSRTIAAKVLNKAGKAMNTALQYSLQTASDCISLNAQTGKITAHKKGTAVVEISAGQCTTTVKVEVVSGPRDMQLDQTSLTLGIKEESEPLGYTLLPPEGEDSCYAEVAWRSSDTHIAIVDAHTGVVTGKKKGSATIYAKTQNGIERSLRVEVLKAPSKVNMPAQTLNLTVGGSIQLNPQVNDGASCRTYKFTSNNNAVARVDAEGLVTAHAAGTATITIATYNKKKTSVKVKVVGVPTSISVKEAYNLMTGDTETIIPVVKDATGVAASASYEYEILTAESQNPDCITVSGTGLIKALKPGSAVVQVKTHNGLTAKCTVNVTPGPEAITLSASSMALGIRETSDQLIAQLTIPEGCAPADAKVAWFTSSAKIVKVDAQTGELTGVKAGTATITARTKNKLEATCTVHVVKKPSSVTVSPRTLRISTGSTEKLSIATNNGAGLMSLKFSSSNDRVATVTDDGSVIAQSPGVATITIKTYNGKKATCAVEVTSEPAQVTVQEAINLVEGETATLKPAALDPMGNAIQSNFTYQVISGADVASVSNAGVIKALKQGVAQIRVTTHNGVHTHVDLESLAETDTICRVTVSAKPAAIELQSTLEMHTGDSLQMIPVVKDKEGQAISGIPVSFSASGSAIVISDDGTITGVRSGTATVTATAGDISASCLVTVTGSDISRYRVFSACSYFKKGTGSGNSGQLYFTQNNAQSVVSVLTGIDKLGFQQAGMTLTNPSKATWLDAMDNAFLDSDDMDVNIVYLCSHGYNHIDVSAAKPVHYGLGLPGYTGYTASSDYYITAEEIFNHVRRIKGRVVLILDSCFSGVFITNMKRQLDYEGGRISVLTAADNTRASYEINSDANTASDYFTFYLLEGLGYNMETHTDSGTMPADSNADGGVSLSEMFDYASEKVTTNVPIFARYGNFHGHSGQMPMSYMGDNGDLTIFVR